MSITDDKSHLILKLWQESNLKISVSKVYRPTMSPIVASHLTTKRL